MWCVGNVAFAVYNIAFGAELAMAAKLLMSIACVSLVSAPVDDNSRILVEQFEAALQAHGIHTNAARLLRTKSVPPTATSPGYTYTDGMVVEMEEPYVEHE
ncbi:hypothetical protein [Aeromicrobium sp. 179-A 4D2 NHS]|uniref:hypothetical protein n=1 Tax=Aeromicrobium sp. 179-A 4D2 NHS TaxID=3142375 RepID=UPI00399F35E9